MKFGKTVSICIKLLKTFLKQRFYLWEKMFLTCHLQFNFSVFLRKYS